MQPLAPTGGTPLAVTRRPGFGAGVASLFGGFGFVIGTPGMWPLAMVPVAVATTITGVLGWLAVTTVPARVAAALGGGVLSTLAAVVAAVAAVIGAVLIGLGLAQPLSGPALNRIVRAVETREGAPAWPPTRAIDDVLHGLSSIVVPYAFGVPLLTVLFLLSLTPAAPIALPLKLVVLAIMIAWDLCDYPLSQRGVPTGARVAFMKRHASAMVGFGVGLALLSLLPCALVLVLPAGVAGAARLVVHLERWDRQAAPDRALPP